MHVGFHAAYINTLAQEIKSVLASEVWFQAVAGARTYSTNSPAITSQSRYPFGHGDIYVCVCVCDFQGVYVMTSDKVIQQYLSSDIGIVFDRCYSSMK